MAAAPPFRRFLTFVVLAGMALVLFATRPRTPSFGLVESFDRKTATCLSNLSQISRAYAQYARDYDGKLPRGVDPEDRYSPQTWSYSRQYGSAFADDAKEAPLLHELLRPYVHSKEVFHCPADTGWTVSRLSPPNPFSGSGGFGLRNVLPSSYGRYGTSYYYWTKYGFSLNTAADIEYPAQTILLFDGELWHSNAGRDLINGLFADGHVRNLTKLQFEEFSRN